MNDLAWFLHRGNRKCRNSLGICGYLNLCRSVRSGLMSSQYIFLLIRTACHYHGSRITLMCLMMLHSLSQQVTQWISLHPRHPTQQCLLCHMMTGMMSSVWQVSGSTMLRMNIVYRHCRDINFLGMFTFRGALHLTNVVHPV